MREQNIEEGLQGLKDVITALSGDELVVFNRWYHEWLHSKTEAKIREWKVGQDVWIRKDYTGKQKAEQAHILELLNSGSVRVMTRWGQWVVPVMALSIEET